ncbi:MAG: hypothetical protein GYA87_07670 [Christensenellaceae bacterium]|nr:hypothetical protein [Christensenellaceae bacterium]
MEYRGQIVAGLATNPIKVNINQFYNIEINNFAVSVAKTTLWITESQTLNKTENIVHYSISFFTPKNIEILLKPMRWRAYENVQRAG